MQCLRDKYTEAIKAKPVVVIPNGIASARHIENPMEFGSYRAQWRHRLQADANLGVLCVSRWSHGKSLEFLLEAVPKVVEKLPNIRFAIAGRKEVSWKNDVRSYVQKNRRAGEPIAPLVVPWG